MSQQPTQNQLSGRATGSLFFSGFGAIWIALALYVKQVLDSTSLFGVLVGLGILVSACLWLLGQARNFPKVPEDKEVSRQFRNINLMQWIAIGLAGFTFSKLHLDDYVLSAITAIVGLHLFPLAKLFRYPMHYISAIALVLWAGIGLLVIPVAQLQGTTALGTGIILWLSASISLAIGIKTARGAFSSRPVKQQLDSRQT